MLAENEQPPAAVMITGGRLLAQVLVAVTIATTASAARPLAGSLVGLILLRALARTLTRAFAAAIAATGAINEIQFALFEITHNDSSFQLEFTCS